MKIGVVGIAEGWSSVRLADTVEEATGYRLLVELDKVRLELPSGRAWFEDTDLSTLDGLIIKKVGSHYSPQLLDRLELLRLLEMRGLPIFSAPSKILGVLNRISCTVSLQAGNIPMPPTTVTEDINAAVAAVEEYGEAVFKPLFSTKARGMCVIGAGADCREKIRAFHQNNPQMYIQQKIDLGDHDLGIVFLGGRYLTTYGRCRQKGAWNTTTASGGRYQAFDPEPEIIELARRAQALFGLDFTCVDVALTPQGPIVFEVSAFGGFRGILEARSIDAAKEYVRYVRAQL
nr:GAK system ATP-grasp enzyme [uncultured Desulfobulbus sp.]